MAGWCFLLPVFPLRLDLLFLLAPWWKLLRDHLEIQKEENAMKIWILYYQSIIDSLSFHSDYYCFRRQSYPLLASIVVGISDVVIGGCGCNDGGDGRGVLGAYVVISTRLGAVVFPTVLAQKHRLLVIGKLSSATLLVVLVAHQTGKVG